MSELTDKVADLAFRWVQAESERKVRLRERRIAWMMAFKSGIEKRTACDGGYDSEPRTELVANTDEQRAALKLAREATERHCKVAAVARSLRGAMTRAMGLPEPVPNAEVEAAYKAMCDAEDEANRKLVAEILEDM